MNKLELSKHFINLDINDFKKEDIESLSKLIEYHSDLYYNKQDPIISDTEYDILFKKLELLEEKFEIKNKQTSKVWSQIISSTFEKVAHSRPMISLDNTYNSQDLKDFDERVKKNINSNIDFKNDLINYTIEYKFDWLWVELIYEEWNLIRAITRWNWIEGEDVTENIKLIKNIPKKIPYTKKLEVRWEVVMPISSFEKLNKELLNNKKKPFSNPRNAASWSVRLKDSSITASRNLKFFAYDLANFEEFIIKEKKYTYFDIINDLKSFWFEISDYFPKCCWIEEVINEIKNFQKKDIDFDIDWLVIKVNNIDLWNSIWFTAHHPRYAIAYKFPSEIVTTQVIWVEHQIWRTWTLTPVANLKEVNIWWVIVKRSTLHNYNEIKKLWVMIWDYVFIKRAGEVIPKIISVIKEERTWKEIDITIPKNCPSCGSKIIKDKDKVRYYCPNHFHCPEQLKQKLIYWVWKEWLNIDWLWKEQIELFLKKWFINDLASIFDLEKYKDDILSLEWYKQKSVDNILNSIKKSKTIKLQNLISALSIPWVWKKAAWDLAKLFSSKDDLLNFKYTVNDLIQIKDIWEVTAKNIFDFFTLEEHKYFLKRLVSRLDIVFEEIVKNWIFKWKKICITGSFEGYSREKLIEIIEKNSWTFTSSVSKNTDFLIAWEKAWSKLKKANELWVRVVSLEEFLRMLN